MSPSTSNQDMITNPSSGGSTQRNSGSSDAKRTAPSASANNETGFSITSIYLRSILIHPIGLLLASILNEVPLSEKICTIGTGLSREELTNNSSSTSSDVRDTILSSAMSEWKTRKEKDLTAEIKKKIDTKINEKTLDGYGTVKDEALLTRENEKEIGPDRKGKVDFVISKKCSDEKESKRSVVMIIEFGIPNNIWWQKMSQVLSYVKLLMQKQGKAYVIDQPLLLTVVTMKRPDPDKTSNEEPVSRFGVFLCIPKGKDDCRLALLWRKDTFNVNEASKQFGKILYAALRCAYLRENEAPYQYLGPNCCRIGDYLYRSYDSRLRPTQRRPDLYETEDTDLFGDCHAILEIADSTDEALLHPFGQLQLPDDIKPINWLWEFRGQIKIIATRFHVGVHYAEYPIQFLPIIEHLELLHEKKYVHGDIRAYNMVLNNDGPDRKPFCRLIDFDYGGKVVVASADNTTLQYPKYPIGYVHHLFDGERPGRSGKDITFEHDWRALGSVILGLYTLVPGSTHKGKHQKEVRKNREIQLIRMRDAYLKWNDESCINRMQDAFTDVGEDCTIIPSENPGRFLRMYINLAKEYGFVLEPTENFEGDLNYCNMSKSRERIDSNGATGSPKIK